jgi:hypothetical protein
MESEPEAPASEFREAQDGFQGDTEGAVRSPLVAGVCDPGRAGRRGGSDRTGLAEAGYNRIGSPPQPLDTPESVLTFRDVHSLALRASIERVRNPIVDRSERFTTPPGAPTPPPAATGT